MTAVLLHMTVLAEEYQNLAKGTGCAVVNWKRWSEDARPSTLARWVGFRVLSNEIIKIVCCCLHLYY